MTCGSPRCRAILSGSGSRGPRLDPAEDYCWLYFEEQARNRAGALVIGCQAQQEKGVSVDAR
jgi:hypothetical protein